MGKDTVPAWLTPGEFVVNQEATSMFGPQIKQMNDAGRAVQRGAVPPPTKGNMPTPPMPTPVAEVKKRDRYGNETTVKFDTKASSGASSTQQFLHNLGLTDEATVSYTHLTLPTIYSV